MQCGNFLDNSRFRKLRFYSSFATKQRYCHSQLHTFFLKTSGTSKSFLSHYPSLNSFGPCCTPESKTSVVHGCINGGSVLLHRRKTNGLKNFIMQVIATGAHNGSNPTAVLQRRREKRSELRPYTKLYVQSSEYLHSYI